MATIVDVARIAGVSTSTVSHVVNSTRPVNEATRIKVVDAIQATGYRQDFVARALRRSRTDSVGLVVSDVAQPVFAEMVRGVEQRAAIDGYTLLLANSSEDPASEARAMATLAAKRVDGIIVAPVARSGRKGIDAIRAAGTPVVFMDRLSKVNADYVGVENRRPMRDLVTHLIVNHGHQRVAFAGGNLAVSTVAERCQGYLDALRDAAIDPDPRYTLTGSGLANDTRTQVRYLLAGRRPPTAIVSASTESAIGVLEAANDPGLSMPNDFAFATFDGFAHPDMFQPRLTTIAQPAHEIGEQAMLLLLGRLGVDRSVRPRVVRVAPTTTYRDSCGCRAATTEMRPGRPPTN
jgi:LacI family transcriptional regulator